MTNNPTPDESRQTEHTPTPWRPHDMEADAIVGPDRKAIALVMGRSRTDAEDEANMEFILEAVNSHASHLARIAALERALNWAMSDRPEPIHIPGQNDAYFKQWHEANALITARLALAPAAGKGEK